MGNHHVDNLEDYYEKVFGEKVKNGSKDSHLNETSLTFQKLFRRIKVLGQGAFGKVILAEHIGTKNRYAVKILHKIQILKKKSIKSVKKEQKLMKEVDHPFIIKLRYVFQDEYRIYFIMDYIKGGDLEALFKKMNKFPLDWVKSYMAELLCALRFLHKNGIIHRDIKMSNILIGEDGHIRLTDFGLSTYFDLEPKSLCGTYKYISPEMLDGVGVKKNLRKGYSFGVDYWALGVLLYKMIFGVTPFKGRDPQTLFYNILFEDLKIPSKSGVDKEAIDLIKRLLEKEEKKRIGYFGGCEEIMKHKFFKGINFDKLEKKKIESPSKHTKNLKIKINHKKSNKTELYSPLIPEMSQYTKKYLKEHQDLFRDLDYEGDETIKNEIKKTKKNSGKDSE